VNFTSTADPEFKLKIPSTTLGKNFAVSGSASNIFWALALLNIAVKTSVNVKVTNSFFIKWI
jgi:hypothetical protein